MAKDIKKPAFWGVGVGLLLLAFYFLVLTLANSLTHAVEQIGYLWYWILPLVVGFGAQVGLYSYVRQEIRRRKAQVAVNKELAASAGISTGSMVACCAHHLVDVLPILGLSAMFLFLAEYQVFFLLFGIVSNIIGIIFMLEIIKKHSLYKTGGVLNRASGFNLRGLRNWAMVGSSLTLLTMFFLIRNDQGKDSLIDSGLSTDNPEVLSDTVVALLPSRTNDEGGLSVEVRPIDFSLAKPVQFEISLNTHQGSLDFDLTQKAALTDDENNQHLPLGWQGGRGGHHLSGTLVFPPVSSGTKKINLKIFDVYGVPERRFEWSLP